MHELTHHERLNTRLGYVMLCYIMVFYVASVCCHSFQLSSTLVLQYIVTLEWIIASSAWPLSFRTVVLSLF